MTSTLTASTSIGPLVHWKTWVVPAVMLREFIHDHQHVWQSQYSPLQHDVSGWEVGNTGTITEDCGWRTHLSIQVSMMTGNTIETTQRNLYRVMSDEGQVIGVDFAEAVVMSLGLFIDQDTTIPVLPGNLRCAQELLEVRDEQFWNRSSEERNQLKRLVMELRNQIIQYPDRLEEIQDEAPFDCLRPLYFRGH